jgi:hypothetical protein
MTEPARPACSGNLKIKEIAHEEQEVRGCELFRHGEREQIQELRIVPPHRY